MAKLIDDATREEWIKDMERWREACTLAQEGKIDLVDKEYLYKNHEIFTRMAREAREKREERAEKKRIQGKLNYYKRFKLCHE